MSNGVRLFHKGKKLKFLRKIIEKFRKVCAENGYTCDGCGKEIFDYPQNRLCEDCLKKLIRAKRTCPKCGRETRAEGVCLDCKKIPPSFAKGVSPFPYKGRTALLINRLKNGAPRLAYFFGEETAREFAKAYPLSKTQEKLLILPVPMTEFRKRERGYNQAEELAKAVERELTALGYEVELRLRTLIKRKDTAMQKHMHFSERAENVASAYHVRERKVCKGRRILLIDDIMTTGATGDICAKRLLSAGAKEVCFLVATALPERK